MLKLLKGNCNKFLFLYINIKILKIEEYTTMAIEKTKSFKLRMDEDLYNEFNFIADCKHYNKSGILRALIRKWIDEEKGVTVENN